MWYHIITKTSARNDTHICEVIREYLAIDGIVPCSMYVRNVPSQSSPINWRILYFSRKEFIPHHIRIRSVNFGLNDGLIPSARFRNFISGGEG